MGSGVGTRRPASSGLTEPRVQMVCSVYALQIPGKERHRLQGGQEECSATADVSLHQSYAALLLNRPERPGVGEGAFGDPEG